MSRSQVPLGHEAMAVFGLASAAEQSLLPYTQDTVFGQQAGHFTFSVGGSAGHGGLGGAFPATLQAPREHRARRVPHCPKSHVVPSGRRHEEPFAGSAAGHSARWTEPPSSPPSSVGVTLVPLSPHAAPSAAAADAITSVTASRAGSPGSRREGRSDRGVTGARIERLSQAC
jgi:hypothetical protein